MSNRTLVVEGHDILRRKHVIDARAGRGLENALDERVGDEALYLLWAFPLRPHFGHLKVARKERACAFGVHALWFLGGGLRVLDDSRKAVLALPHLDIA